MWRAQTPPAPANPTPAPGAYHWWDRADRPEWTFLYRGGWKLVGAYHRPTKLYYPVGPLGRYGSPTPAPWK